MQLSIRKCLDQRLLLITQILQEIILSFISNEKMNDIIKIVKSLEESAIIFIIF